MNFFKIVLIITSMNLVVSPCLSGKEWDVNKFREEFKKVLNTDKRIFYSCYSKFKQEIADLEDAQFQEFKNHKEVYELINKAVKNLNWVREGWGIAGAAAVLASIVALPSLIGFVAFNAVSIDAINTALQNRAKQTQIIDLYDYIVSDRKVLHDWPSTYHPKKK